MNSLTKTKDISNRLNFHTDTGGFSTQLVRIMLAGIPAYAFIKVAQTASLVYLSYFLSFVIAWALFVIIDRLQLYQGYKLLILTAIWVSIAGRIYFYTNFEYYDKMVHFFTPALTACIAYDFLCRATNFNRKIHAFVFVVLLLSMFEVFEFLLDYFQFFEFRTQGVYDSDGNELMSPAMDTTIDLIMGIFAASVALLIRSPHNK